MLNLKKLLTSILKELPKKASLDNNGQTAIASNADLNSYRTPGSYKCTNGTTAATLSNTPFTTGGFALYVISTSNSTTCAQLLIPIAAGVANPMFIRTYRNSAWDGWLMFTATAVS